ncbi:simple sugar transport system ATP-binding protein [Gracilibacillus ureilyticus]|uniref:Simple sugar transport system ATP-binding protein n=1 Tax=Gracilibacillus ureilyticus TaxID=531814 RepID=A0A1H9NZF2_9BACI|nr:ABC transporter ATP-binding protein [Gracilibacillus ureilyticus]SER41356.1 simple sugar transport system ATP-binding protein [Gracilibacillus ureilyticus]
MLLELKGITKKYGDFTANDHIDFSLNKQEIHAIVGENGAGKTTLMRMLYGMEKPTSGEIVIAGKSKTIDNPNDAIALGIGMVHQHFMLFPPFTIAENVVFHHEPRKSWRYDRKKAAEEVSQLAKKFGMNIDPLQIVGDAPVGIQQRVEILKVLYQGADVIILDEPTAVLTPLEVKDLLASLRELVKMGKSIILITHKLNEVMAVSDRVTVLRDGKVTGTLETRETNPEELSRLMVGRELKNNPLPEKVKGKEVLSIKNVSMTDKDSGKSLLENISFQVQQGEIVGIAGVSGNGQSELIQAITGLASVQNGSVTLNGTELTNQSVKQIREAGLAHIPEDRYLWGAAKEASLVDNMMMTDYVKQEFQKSGVLKLKNIRKYVTDSIKKFNVKTTSIDTSAQFLSGGNLQKLIAAREIQKNTPFLLAAEPTRGVDIGAMEFIHEQLIEKRNNGDAVLLISSELSEILALSDRVLVMYEGKIAGEFERNEASEEKLSILMAGGRNE